MRPATEASVRIYNVQDNGGGQNDAVKDRAAFIATLAKVPAEGGTIAISGTNRIDTQIVITRSNIRLRINEDGIIDGSNVVSDAVISFEGSEDATKAVVTGADLPAGTTQFTLSSSAGLAVGDWVRIDSDEIYEFGRVGEDFKVDWGQISAIAGNVVTLKNATSLKFSFSGFAITMRKVNFLENVHVEGTGRVISNPAAQSRGIQLKNCFNSSITGVRGENAGYASFELNSCVRSAVYHTKATNKGAVIHSLEYGIRINQSYLCDAHDNYLEVPRSGIDGDRSLHIDVYDNRLYNCDLAPHSNEFWKLRQNRIISGRLLCRAANTELIGNYIEPKSILPAISFAEHARSGDLIVEGNIIRYPAGTVAPGDRSNGEGYGIYFILLGTKNLTISNNWIYNAPDAIYCGITTDSPANTDLRITNNKLYGLGAGDAINASRWLNFTIAGNHIEGRTAASGIGISAQATAGTYEGGRIDSNKIKNRATGISTSSHYPVIESDNTDLGGVTAMLDIADFASESFSGPKTFTTPPKTSGTPSASDDLVTVGFVTNITDGMQPLSEKDQPNGYAGLNASGKISASSLPASVMEFKGMWDASTNTPTIADGTGDAGDVYRVDVAGTQNLGSGAITFAVGEFAIYNGTIWQRSPAGDAVTSVNGRTGAVVGLAEDNAVAHLDLPESFIGLKTFTKQITISRGTVVADSQAIGIDETWNNAGVLFTLIKANVINTASTAGSLFLNFQTSGTSRFSVSTAGSVTLANAANIIVGTGTGSIIATSVTQKIGFHGVAPTAQRAGIAQAPSSTTAATLVSPWGYTTQAQADGVITLLNEIRATLVEKGIFKGFA